MNISLHKKQLKELFLKKKIPHAIVVESLDLKSAYVYILRVISVLFCKSEKEKPCEICDGCFKVLNEIHPDVKAVSFLKDAKFIKIDQIREIRKDAYIIPNEGDYKIYILSPADTLTVEAQNAFIKILESPPKNVIFILLTESSNLLLKTILSRCEVFKIRDDSSESEDLDSVKFARDITNLSLNDNKIEMFKLISLLSSGEKIFFRDVLTNIIRNLVNIIREKEDSNLSLKIIKKIEHLSEILNFLDKNVNLNLLVNYLIAVL